MDQQFIHLKEAATKNSTQPRSKGKTTRKRTTERNRLRETDLKTLTLNIRGLRTNIGALANICCQQKPHVVVVVETFLDATVSDGEDCISIPGYNISCRKDRNANGGGIIVYCMEGIAIYHDASHDPTHLELMWFSIALKEQSILVAAVYRPPSSGDEIIHYLDSSAMQKLDDFKAKSLCFVGDFNVHHQDWLGSHFTDRPGKLLLEVCNSLNLRQAVTEPTRLDQILDLVITDLPVTCTTLANCGSSDHNPVLFQIKKPVYCEKPYRRKVWKYNHADFWGMRGHFSNYDWDAVFESNDPEECCTQVTKVITDAMDMFIPNKSVTNKVTDKPWFNDQCRRLTAKKRRVFNIKKKNPSDMNIKAFQKVQKEYKRAEKRARAQHSAKLKEELSNEKLSSKKWWKTVNSLAGKSSKTNIPVLKKDGVMHSTTQQKVEVLANTFAEKCKLDQCDDSPPTVTKETSASMSNFKFKPKEVRHILKNLKIEKATGKDQIPNRVLKACSAELASPLCRLFTLCFDNTCFPSQWKHASVIPLHKRSSKSDPTMYRPISLLSNISKIMEAVIAKSMKKFFLRHDLISNRQFGFRPNHSTSDILTILSQKWSAALDEGKEVFAVALDIKGAFDRVWHNGLSAKLQAKGISGKLLKWIESYLTGRSLEVILNGQSSSTFYFNASVPQGSILGPLLFSIFIDDIVSECENELFLYADDSTLYCKVDSISKRAESAASINRDLVKLKAWADRWKVIFEPSKCQAMIVSRKRNAFDLKLYFDGTEIAITNELKILGVTFDSKLTWNKHLSNVSGRAGQKLGALRRVSSNLSTKGRANVYKSQVRSVMEVSSLAWLGAAPTHLNKLDAIQSRAIKIIGITEEAAANDFNIQSLEHRRKVASSTLMYKMHTPSCPDKLKELRPPAQTRRRTTRLNSVIQQHALQTKRTRTQSFDRTFTNSGVSLWNDLPSDVVGVIDSSDSSQSDIQHFKKRVNKYLLENSF